MRPLLTPVTCLFLLLLSGCGRRPTTGVSVLSKFQPAIPAGTSVLAQLDLTHLKNTSFYARHSKDLDNLPLLNAAAGKLGFDPRRDLSAILLAAAGEQYLVLADGAWNAQTIGTKLTALGVPESIYRGIILVNNGAESGAFLSKDVAAIGPPPAVRAAIDQNRTGRANVPQEFASLLAGLPPTAQLWLASRNGLPFVALISRSDISSALANITPDIAQSTAAITFASGAHVEINLLCFPGVSQRRVHDAIGVALAFARITSQNADPALAQLYNSIQVDEEGQTVRLGADLTSAQTDELLLTASNFRLR